MKVNYTESLLFQSSNDKRLAFRTAFIFDFFFTSTYIEYIVSSILKVSEVQIPFAFFSGFLLFSISSLAEATTSFPS